jgi:hypothetical protein
VLGRQIGIRVPGQPARGQLVQESAALGRVVVRAGAGTQPGGETVRVGRIGHWHRAAPRFGIG